MRTESEATDHLAKHPRGHRRKPRTRQEGGWPPAAGTEILAPFSLREIRRGDEDEDGCAERGRRQALPGNLSRSWGDVKLPRPVGGASRVLVSGRPTALRPPASGLALSPAPSQRGAGSVRDERFCLPGSEGESGARVPFITVLYSSGLLSHLVSQAT